MMGKKNALVFSSNNTQENFRTINEEFNKKKMGLDLGIELRKFDGMFNLNEK